MTDQTDTYRLCRFTARWHEITESKKAELEAVMGFASTDEPVGSKRRNANA